MSLRPRQGLVVRSLPAGAFLGALAILASAAVALWLTGYIEAFSRNRGFLQLVLGIPVSGLLTAAALSYFGALAPRQLILAILPVEVLILGAAEAFGGNLAAWYWAGVANLALFLPWTAGIVLGVAIRPRG